MRPRQWTKNGIVFLALVFSVGQEYHLSDPSTWVPKVLEALVAFACFAMVSSAEYLVNDIRDVEADRAHPKKRYRPDRRRACCRCGPRGCAAVVLARRRQRRRVRAQLAHGARHPRVHAC